jgi:hypothetical protein
MKRLTVAGLVFMAVCMLFGAALAGVYSESVTYDSKSPEKQTVTKMYIEGDKLRIEQPGEEGSIIIIFRGDKNLVWMIEPGKKQYEETTKEDVLKMKEQLDQAKKMMEEQMKNMPPEQREQMEKMMGNVPGITGEEMTITYKLVGKGEKVNDYTCEHYAAFSNGQKTWDLWSVDYKDVSVGYKDLAPLEALGEFFAEISGYDIERYFVGSEEPLKGEEGPRFHGMPVKWSSIEADSVVHVNELKILEKKTIDASMFELPEGLKKVTKQAFPQDE